MDYKNYQLVVNGSEQEKRSSRLSLLVPVRLISFLTVVVACACAAAQCYVDPSTGQRICARPESSRSSAPVHTVESAAHCRISLANGTLGSGTLVARNESLGLVLTCSHLFTSSKSQITVTFPGGRKFAANLVEIDRANDLAVLVIRRPDAEPLAVSTRDPNGALMACGFGPNGVFRCNRGRVTGYCNATGASFPSTTIAGAVRPGDSGGGVLDESGQVVGVVWGQRDGQTYATCGRPVCDFFRRVRDRLFAESNLTDAPARTSPQSPGAPSKPDFDWQTWSSELDARIRALDAKKQDKGDYLLPGDLNRYLRIEDASTMTSQFAPRAEVDNKLKNLGSRFDSIHEGMESVRQRIETVASDRLGWIKGVSVGKFAVAALGLSGPVAAAVVVAGGLAGWRIKSRLRRLESQIGRSRSVQNAADPQPIAVDSPPPPQRTMTETHYVPIEKDSFAKAHQWASEHVARKYPGATEVLQTQDSLIKQYLAAK